MFDLIENAEKSTAKTTTWLANDKLQIKHSSHMSSVLPCKLQQWDTPLEALSEPLEGQQVMPMGYLEQPELTRKDKKQKRKRKKGGSFTATMDQKFFFIGPKE